MACCVVVLIAALYIPTGGAIQRPASIGRLEHLIKKQLQKYNTGLKAVLEKYFADVGACNSTATTTTTTTVASTTTVPVASTTTAAPSCLPTGAACTAGDTCCYGPGGCNCGDPINYSFVVCSSTIESTANVCFEFSRSFQ
ncbi:unnamed protein product [Adineta steineri]|uniref:Granulins domain-containing protein n=1 Tax=Adineta steineri TaxID=433720 RepID=A0A814BUA3_9BILA|nr:unnamed protein product [Adineta steineri]